MSKHRDIKTAIATVITGIVGTDPKVLGLDERDGNERTWPGRLTLSSGLVHGYVIRWALGDQAEARTPGTAEEKWVFEIKAYHSKLDAETNDTFYDKLEAIQFALKPEMKLDLAGGGHIRLGAFRWENAEQSPQGDKPLLYSVGTINVRFREGC